MSTPLGRSPARPAAEPVEKKAAARPASATPPSTTTQPQSATQPQSETPKGLPWFVAAGVGLWRLRLALGSGIISATFHTVLVIALAFIAAPEWNDRRAIAPADLEAVITPPKVERREIPRLLEPIKVKVETTVQSISPKNQAARGTGSAGSGGGSGGGTLGGFALLGTERSSNSVIAGGTGSGIDSAYGTHMLGEVGELGEAKATFFGIEAKGRKFVFVVDTSGSMSHNDRYLRCRDELLRSVTAMQYGQQYFIIFFSDKLYPMPENRLVYAKPDQLQKTTQWLVGATPDGGTEPWPGLQRALRMEPDAVYLLTDGQFDPEVVRKVDRIQPETKKKIPIHTIAFESQQGAILLEAIAKQSGGTFRFVP